MPDFPNQLVLKQRLHNNLIPTRLPCPRPHNYLDLLRQPQICLLPHHINLRSNPDAARAVHVPHHYLAGRRYGWVRNSATCIEHRRICSRCPQRAHQQHCHNYRDHQHLYWLCYALFPQAGYFRVGRVDRGHPLLYLEQYSFV